jgi:hypothetical protein
MLKCSYSQGNNRTFFLWVMGWKACGRGCQTVSSWAQTLIWPLFMCGDQLLVSVEEHTRLKTASPSTATSHPHLQLSRVNRSDAVGKILLISRNWLMISSSDIEIVIWTYFVQWHLVVTKGLKWNTVNSVFYLLHKSICLLLTKSICYILCWFTSRKASVLYINIGQYNAILMTFCSAGLKPDDQAVWSRFKGRYDAGLKPVYRAFWRRFNVGC